MDKFGNNIENQAEQPASPHRVSRRAIIVAIVLFACIVVGMFTFAFLKKNEIQEEVVTDTEVQPVTEEEYASITRIDAKHFYDSGVHTLVGEVVMPTPCDLLESSAIVMESYPEKIVIDFTVINTASFCEEIPTPQRFKVSAPASAEALFSAKFMGRAVELNLIPAAEGETPDSFELFIKG